MPTSWARERQKFKNMEKYDYQEAVKSDILDYIADHENDIAKFDDIDNYREHLHDTLWTVDSVTGNASGSYTFNAWQAEEYLCHNLELMQDTAREFGIEYQHAPKYGTETDYQRRQRERRNSMLDSAEYWDVSIRCYLLGGCIAEILETDQFAELWDKYHQDEQDENN